MNEPLTPDVLATLKEMVEIALEDRNPAILQMLSTLSVTHKCQLWGHP